MRKPKPPRLITVAILTTVTIVFWIFYSVYQILTADPPVDVAPELLEPISPELDVNSLNSVNGRKFFEEGQTIPLSIVDFEGQETVVEENVTELQEEPAEEDDQEEATGSSEINQ